MNDALKSLDRYSTPAKALSEPAPDQEQLEQILAVALTAPDHGRLRPYRFITIRGDARQHLSEIFAEAILQREPDVEPADLQKQKDKPLRSPLIVVVVASLIDSPKIPEIEQMLSAGAAAHNILLASNALGFGSIWLTGANAYDPFVCKQLGLGEHERIIGFVFLGTPDFCIPRATPPRVDDYLSDWE